MSEHPTLILGSSSPYRRQLLARLGVPFEVVVPDVDETPLPGENTTALVERLALSKAQTVANAHPQAIVIGSDQIAVLGSQIFGKPGTRQRAIEQLSQASGQSVIFLTAVCVIGRGRITGCTTVPTVVRFRMLSRDEIERYLDKEPALNCAGSFQSEGLGLSLCESVTSDDPTALIGLPLTVVRRLIAECGVVVP